MCVCQKTLAEGRTSVPKVIRRCVLTSVTPNSHKNLTVCLAFLGVELCHTPGVSHSSLMPYRPSTVQPRPHLPIFQPPSHNPVSIRASHPYPLNGVPDSCVPNWVCARASGASFRTGGTVYRIAGAATSVDADLGNAVAISGGMRLKQRSSED